MTDREKPAPVRSIPVPDDYPARWKQRGKRQRNRL
jgi:hypothetical protein